MLKLQLLWMLGIVVATCATELGLEGLRPSELKEIEKEIAAGNVPPEFNSDKSKRLVPKLTNTDSPSFNHLGVSNSKPSLTYSSVAQQSAYNPTQHSYNPAQSTFGASQPAFNPAQLSSQASYNPAQLASQSSFSSAHLAGQAAYNPAQLASQPSFSSAQLGGQASYNPAQLSYSSPLNLLQRGQYFPVSQYLPYLQNSQLASQLASQYSYQPAAQPHYLQTPTQIQYVSPPSFGQAVPSAQFKALSSKAPAATSSTTQPQSGVSSQPTSQVVLPSNMYSVYPQQQSYLMFLVPPQQSHLLQQSPLLHPAHQMLFLGGQNQLLQQLFANQHRFSYPYTSSLAAGQLNYLTGATAAAQPQVDAAPSDASQQQSAADSSSNLYNVRAKQ